MHPTFERLQVALGCALLLAAAGCSGDSPAGCTTDDQCKGDRICVQGTCVDPDAAVRAYAADAGTADANAGGNAGTQAGGAGGSAVAGSGGELDDPALEHACSLDCEARHSAGCAMNTGSLDQCLAQCLVIDESTQGYCWDEMTARYACLASGGYTCVSGYPQPQATCVAEATALSACNQTIPCRAYCDAAPAQCQPQGDDCVTACMQTQSGFADAICGIYYNQLLNCWTREHSCATDDPAVGTCGPAIAQVADCIAVRNHECDGFCWAADTLGCGSDQCVSDCKAKADASSCGTSYRRLLDCSIGDRELRLSCESGEPTPDATACASELADYETCMQGQ